MLVLAGYILQTLCDAVACSHNINLQHDCILAQCGLGLQVALPIEAVVLSLSYCALEWSLYW